MKKINIEFHNHDITQMGINSIIDFYRTISVNKYKFSDTIAFVTGVASPFLNVLFDLRSERINSSTLIDAASQFFESYKVPWGWFIIPSSTDNDLIQHGFSLLEESPAMYFNLKETLPRIESSFITIHEAVDENDLSLWIQPINERFEIKEGDDQYLMLNVRYLKQDKKKLRHFFAYYKGELATSATLFLSDNAVMLHNVATKTTMKNRGIATAVTLHMMDLAKKMGFENCFLDSSEEAFSLYKKLGFTVYATTLIYSKS